MQEAQDIQLIEVKKIIAEDRESNKNTGSSKMTINVCDIQSFRPWHKGRNDTNIEGDITQVFLHRERKKMSQMDNGEMKEQAGSPNEKPFRSMLIEENYEEFKYRLSMKVKVKDLNRVLYDTP